MIRRKRFSDMRRISELIAWTSAMGSLRIILRVHYFPGISARILRGISRFPATSSLFSSALRLGTETQSIERSFGCD